MNRISVSATSANRTAVGGTSANRTAENLIAIAAGGTGGHVFPAATLAQELQRRGHRIHVLTDARGLAYSHAFTPADDPDENPDHDQTYAEVPITQISAGAVVGKSVWHQITSILSLLKGIWQARRTLAKDRPALLIGFGGYPSIAPMIAAWTLGIPSLLHEQNAIMGVANRMASRIAGKVALSFDATLGQSCPGKAQIVGNPVRADVAQISPYVAPSALDELNELDELDAPSAHASPNTSGELTSSGTSTTAKASAASATDPIRLLVFGGSQGAQVMADLVPAAVAALPAALRARLHLTLQLRADDQPAATRILEAADIAHFDIRAFLDPMADFLDAAHLIIARSGATTVCEIAAAGRPAIFIPLALQADAQQARNATPLKAKGAALVLDQTTLTAADLCQHLQTLLNDPARLARMAAAARAVGRPQATQDLADLALSLIPLSPHKSPPHPSYPAN